MEAEPRGQGEVGENADVSREREGEQGARMAGR